MKYNQLLFIIICFSITTLSDAMDSKNNSLDKFLEITTVENPWRAKYITNKTIVIVGDRGNDYGCTFIDLKKEKIQHISSFWDDFRYVSIACLQIHNKKIINSHGKILTIYDAQTGTKEQFVERQKSIRAFACDSSDNLFLCYGEGNKGIITKYNYITKDTIDISISRSFCDIM
ncbi:MAG TPA: hypothetical protein VLB80_02785, partial [Candidatus Babeliales bacterium]|nr:hypothetical protein [Candidatus Babeliales bacterium]